MVDATGDGSGPFADGKRVLDEWVFVRGYDARWNEGFRAEGADQEDIVGSLLSRRGANEMRAGERRRLNLDTVVEFPAGEPLHVLVFISVGVTLRPRDDGFNSPDTLGQYGDGFEYKWRTARRGSGGEILYRDGDGPGRLLFRAARVP